MAPAPPLILLLGMHRSGTSLLGGILQALGVGLPGELIAADSHNPAGYFEWQEVVDLQERLLIDLERWWPSAQGTQPLPKGWRHHPATLGVRDRLRALLLQEYRRQQGPWAIKDPRTSRLLPLWLDLAAELQLPLRVLLAVRDPAEVVQSLIQRDGPITGMDLARAQQLWWRHNLEPLHAAPADLPLAVVDFGAWFAQPHQQLERLQQCMPELPFTAERRQAALALIRPEHRRSHLPAGERVLDAQVVRLHRRLLMHRAGHDRWPSAAPPRSLTRLNPQPPKPLLLASQPERWAAWLEAWRFHPAPCHPGPAPLAQSARLTLCGTTHHIGATHLWIDRLPIPALASCTLADQQPDRHNLDLTPQASCVADGYTRIAINAEIPPPERAHHWLDHLRTQQAIWDPEPARVLLLRALGLPAFWLDPQGGSNGWLQQQAAVDPGQWAARLGLAPRLDQAVVVLGHAGPGWDLALAQEAAQGLQESATPQFVYLPGWPELCIDDPATALAQAGWLAQLKTLVWVGAASEPIPAGSAVRQYRVQPPITPAELRAELSAQPRLAFTEDRPTPPLDELFAWAQLGDPEPEAAVVVSLYNYRSYITAALNSVGAQDQKALELIVVDDASTDEGSDLVKVWMQAQIETISHPFVRLRLLRHRRNVGLATSRNTAFAAARSPWCFVLDADNILYPQAVSVCLQMAQQGNDQLAVVHPLLAVEREDGRPDEQRSLVGTAAWQRQRFKTGNVVDAMALIRRSAWQHVGGYTHIEGGWEDFDFWCKLIDADYTGMQVPQVLAMYRSHAQSMSHQSTNGSWRLLSRTLMQRHPWLDLPLSTTLEVL